MLEEPDNSQENEETEGSRGWKSPLIRWLQKKMAELHQDLQGDDWPEGGDRLRHELGGLEASVEDMEILSLVINDALEGVDITRRYPTFYRRLLADPHLRQIFLDAMESLERSEAGELEPLPEAADIDLSFLASEEREETSPPSPAEQLRIILTRTRDQLRELFAPPPAAIPVRSAMTGMEDDYITLLRSNVLSAQGEFEVILEGQRPATANALQLTVMLVPQEEVMGGPELQATLEWGTYQETAPLDRRGRATFPPLPLDIILDDRGEVRSGLELRLTA